MYYKQYQKNNRHQAYRLQPYINIVSERVHFRQETQDVYMYYMHVSCTLELTTKDENFDIDGNFEGQN